MVAGAAMDECRSHGLRLVAPGDDEWPAVLAKDPWTAPLGLWVRGRGSLARLSRQVVAVTGRQVASPHGVEVAAELGRRIAGAGWTVATLGRFGVDSAALRGALDDALSERRAAPMALPFGRLVETPGFHTALFRRVERAGVLLSEHGADHPDPTHRPDTRRQTHLLAALASAVVLVEPNGRGGDAGIVRAAADASRPVLVVPGPVTAPSFEFAHALIRSGRARLITGASDVLDALGGDR